MQGAVKARIRRMRFFDNCFRKIEGHANVPIAVIKWADSSRSTPRRTPAGGHMNIVQCYVDLNAPDLAERKKSPGGRRKSLKRLDPEKEIQENPRRFL
jgi:hypothetical protein